jgi:hypothetical protein
MQTPTEASTAARLDHLMTLVAETLRAYRSGECSLLERGVFNGLLANTIHRGGAATAMSDVLESIQKDMLIVVRQYTTHER